jgi:hypothetical protein
MLVGEGHVVESATLSSSERAGPVSHLIQGKSYICAAPIWFGEDFPLINTQLPQPQEYFRYPNGQPTKQQDQSVTVIKSVPD